MTRPRWYRDPQLRAPLWAGVGASMLAVGLGLWTESWLSAVMFGLTGFLTVLAVVLVRLLIHKERDGLLNSGLRAPSHAPLSGAREPGRPGRAEPEAAASLESRFKEIVHDLRARHRGKAGLYAVPWWLVLGATGSGKSRLIDASGLDVPAQLAPGRVRAGSCELLLSNDAVVIEAPGDWIEQDRDEWPALLQLLRRARPRGALNGVILTVSARTLLAGRGALTEHGRGLRRRLNEVRVRLGVDVPVYVVVTQADALDGFAETARLLPTAWQQQAFGWTNDLRHLSDPGDTVRDRVVALSRRLDRLLPELLLRETDAGLHRALFCHPQELAALAKPLGELVGTMFAADPYGDAAPFLRGVYLTSAAPQAPVAWTTLARLGVAVPRAQAALPGPAFVQELIHEVIREDDNLAVPDPRIGPLGRGGVLAAAAAGSIWLLAIWGVSFAQNLGGTRALVQLAERTAASRAPTLEELASLRQRLELELQHRASPVQWLGFDRLGPAVERTRALYVRSFRAGFDRPTQENLASALRGEDERSVEAVIALSSDLRFLSTRGGGAVPKLDPYRPTTVRDAEGFTREYARFVALLSPQEIEALLAQRKPLRRTAESLLELSLLEKITREPGGSLPPVRYADFGLETPQSGAGMIEGIYTPEGREDLIDRLLGSRDGRSAAFFGGRLADFERRYSERYLERWRTFLESAPVRERASRDLLRSPYVALVIRAEESLRVQLPAPAQGAAEPAAGAAPLQPWLTQLREVRRSALLDDEEPRGAAGEQASTQERSLAQRIRGVWQDWRVRDPLGKDAPWTRYIATLREVQEVVDAVADAGSGRALTVAVDVASGNADNVFVRALDAVRREVVPDRAGPFAQKLRALLEAPILDGLTYVLAGAREELDIGWRTQIVDVHGRGGLSGSRLAELCAARDEFLAADLAPFLRAGLPRPLLGDRSLPLGSGFVEWARRSSSACRTVGGGASAGAGSVLRIQGEPPRIESAPSGALVRATTLQLACASGTDRYVYRSGSFDPHTFAWGPDCDEVALSVELKVEDRTLELRGPTWRGPLALSEFLKDGQVRDAGRGMREWRVQQDGVVVRVAYQVLSGGDLAQLAFPRPPASLAR